VGPPVDPVFCERNGPETRAWLSKAMSFWIIFRLLRRNHRTARAITASNTSPPTTPPAIAPALVDDFPADGVVVGVEAEEEVEMLVLVVIADEEIGTGVLVRSVDQVISFHRSWSNFYGLLF